MSNDFLLLSYTTLHTFTTSALHHVLLIADEEVGGRLGMEAFLKSSDWETLNVGFVLDEGLASPSEVFTVFYGERVGCCIHRFQLIDFMN